MFLYKYVLGTKKSRRRTAESNRTQLLKPSVTLSRRTPSPSGFALQYVWFHRGSNSEVPLRRRPVYPVSLQDQI